LTVVMEKGIEMW